MLHSYRNHSIDMQHKLIDWFLHECNISLISVKHEKYQYQIQVSVASRKQLKLNPIHDWRVGKKAPPLPLFPL